MPLINLDQAVINALAFFAKNKPKKLNLKEVKFPLVVGSGNAYNTGQILFSGIPAIFADENNLKETIKKCLPLIKKKIITEAIVISASGEKDSVWEVKLTKKNKLKTILLTCSPESSAGKIADKVYSYRKLSEPYTYNTSTYLSMILSATNEDPKTILNQIKKTKLPKKIKKYSSYAFVLPDKYLEIAKMLEIKGRELFGPYLQLRAYTQGEARHAKFIHPSKKELVISLFENIKNNKKEENNLYFGDKRSRLDISLPKNSNFALILSLTYYIIGTIQAGKPKYFQKNIEKFCQETGPKSFGSNKPFEVLVKGN